LVDQQYLQQSYLLSKNYKNRFNCIAVKKIYLVLEHLPLTLFVLLIYIWNESSNTFFIYLIFFFGWLNDIDHLIDYGVFLYRFKKKISINYFFSGKYFKKNKKIYLLLHSYEITFFLLLIGIILDKEGMFFVTFAHLLHLAQDQFKNDVNKYSYFFIYRINKDFNFKKICSS